MGIGKLEPLYRYLQRVEGEPLSTMLKDINTLSQGGYIRKEPSDKGCIRIITDSVIDSEIKLKLSKETGVTVNHSVSLQAAGDSLFVAVSRVSASVNKTILAFSVDGRNIPTLHFAEQDSIMNEGLASKSIYSSTLALYVNLDGTISNGFTRHETTFRKTYSGIAIKIDLKSSRIKPLFFSIHHLDTIDERVINYGAEAESIFTGV